MGIQTDWKQVQAGVVMLHFPGTTKYNLQLFRLNTPLQTPATWDCGYLHINPTNTTPMAEIVSNGWSVMDIRELDTGSGPRCAATQFYF